MSGVDRDLVVPSSMSGILPANHNDQKRNESGADETRWKPAAEDRKHPPLLQPPISASLQDMNTVALEQLGFQSFAGLVKTKFRVWIDARDSLDLELCDLTPPRVASPGGT